MSCLYLGGGGGFKLPSICASWNGRIFERPSCRLRIWKVELFYCFCVYLKKIWDGYLLLTFVGVYYELFMESGMMIFFFLLKTGMLHMNKVSFEPMTLPFSSLALGAI